MPAEKTTLSKRGSIQFGLFRSAMMDAEMEERGILDRGSHNNNNNNNNQTGGGSNNSGNSGSGFTTNKSNENMGSAEKLAQVQKQREEQERLRKSWSHVLMSFFLSIRVRTIIVLILIIAIMMAVFLAILISVFFTSFKQLEQETTEDATQRLSRAIYDDLDQQMTRLLSYSTWVCIRLCVIFCIFVYLTVYGRASTALIDFLYGTPSNILTRCRLAACRRWRQIDFLRHLTVFAVYNFWRICNPGS